MFFTIGRNVKKHEFKNHQKEKEKKGQIKRTARQSLENSTINRLFYR